MRQQFVRIYIGVAVALLLGASATLFMVNREFHAVRRAGFEGRMAELVTMIRARMAEAAEAPDIRTRTLERIADTYRLSIRLEPMAGLALPSEEKKRVRAGETVAIPAGEGFEVYAAVSDSEAVVLEPIRRPRDGRWAYRFLGAGRLADLVERVREKMAEIEGDADARTRALDALGDTLGVRIRIEPVAEQTFSPEESGRMRAGETVAVSTENGLRIYAAFSDSEAVVLGPFPKSRDRGRRGFFPGPPGRRDGDRREFLSRPPDQKDRDRREFFSGPPGPRDRGRRGFPPSPFPGDRDRRFFLPGPDFLLLGMLAATLLLIGVAIYFLIRPLERRIHALSGAAERFGQGDLESRAQAGRGDSIAELAGTFNWMADRIEGLVEGQRELLRAVSHEFRTPMARLFFMLDDAQTADTSEEKNQHLLRIQKSLNDLNDLVEELLTFVRLEGGAAQPDLEEIDVASVVWEMPDVVMDLRDDLSIEISCEQPKVPAVSRYFRRAILNLVTNAVRHARKGIWITCNREGDALHISVDDDGPGIPEAQRERVFEPFSRLDESRSSNIGGTGLGLAIVQRIMRLHNGSVRAEESPHGGARFTLSFPGKTQDIEADMGT